MSMSNLYPIRYPATPSPDQMMLTSTDGDIIFRSLHDSLRGDAIFETEYRLTMLL
jgi:hypothetical protein